jgi:membrane protease subunit (stomatin/prohibitin family)
MGLIKAAIGAIGSTMHDQWKDLISCENMDNDTLMVMKTTETGVISRKSIIRVMPGQCAVILQNGKVLDASAEEGDYTFDESTSPSFFAGNFGAVFKEMWQRFTFGGQTVGKQAIYYFNTKEIIDNKFGTPTPIVYRDWSHPIPNQMTGGITPLSVRVMCHGTYSFKIIDPALFMHEIAGTATVYKKDQIVEQMRSEVIAVFRNVVNELGTEQYKVPVEELESQTDEIKQMMDERVFDEPIRKRGLAISTFALLGGVTLDEESRKKIDEYNLSSNAQMQQGTLVGAYADAVRDAAKGNGGGNGNGDGKSSGSNIMEGFMGMAMMNMASNGMFTGAVNNAATQAAQNVQQVSPEVLASAQQPVRPGEAAPATSVENTWKCPKCGKENTGNFCAECGEKKPEAPAEPEKIKCPKCGKEVEPGTKFCPECGEKLQ